MKRHFYLGDEWVYYKLFCGKRSADMVLTNAVMPLTSELLSQNYIDRWFFIRYTQDGPHLRLRLHMKNTRNIGAVIETVKNHLESYLSNGVIWSMQADTYSRELERYGTDSIEVTEAIFYLDSQFCIKALNLIEDDKLTFLTALSSIDGLLTVFNLDITKKVDFVKQNFEAFKKEAHADKRFNKQLNLKYQTLKKDILEFLTLRPEEFLPLFNLLEQRNETLQEIVSQNDQTLRLGGVSKTNYIKHHVHMMVNRLFRDQQRLYELVCYSCLYRFYQSQKNLA